MSATTNGAPIRVLVAGGARGVGRACAEALASQGAELILCDVDGIALTDAGQRLGAFTRYCDAVEELSVSIFAAEIAEKFTSIDVLINAAGRGYVRALSMMRLARTFMPLLRRGSARRLLVNIAPAGGYVASRGMFPYASSLSAFERLSEALAEQVRGTSIEVATVVPRLVRGPHANAGDSVGLYQLQRVDGQHTAARIAEMILGADRGLGDQEDDRGTAFRGR
ncbi:MAG TPA: SDR family NAD(P)-dependent oxidoreductase [Sphingomicrobium sp.]|jgi:2-keto-3-deoxy-L-fuconate dehydrogenase